MTLHLSFYFPSDNILDFLNSRQFPHRNTHLCERLVEDGSRFVAFDRYKPNGNKGLGKNVNWFVEKQQVRDRDSTKYYV